MEDIAEFIKKIEFEMDEIEPDTIKPETNFRELEQWSSMMGLIFIALIDTEYNVTLNGNDLINCVTVNDLYQVVKSKI
ncbi:MAG: acyl carrier protein [Flavobacteriales bacterium]|nr:acyl carrier protein [Flavobacteriales bacterium]MCL4855729.1 acyl carrier protein [Flavobacteriales bacterium]